MQRIHNPSPSTIKRILKNLFITSTHNSPTLELCLLYIEILTYIFFICQSTIISSNLILPSPALPPPAPISSTLLLLIFPILLLACLLLKLLTKTSLIRGLYLLSIIYSFVWKFSTQLQVNNVRIVVFILVGLLLITDVFGNLEYQVNTKNVYSGVFGIGRMMHYPVVVCSAVLHLVNCQQFRTAYIESSMGITTTVLPPKLPIYLPSAVSIPLFFILLILHLPTQTVTNTTKTPLTKFYLLSLLYNILQLLQFIIPTSSSPSSSPSSSFITINGYIRISIVIFVFLIVQGWQKWKSKKIKVGSQLSGGNIIGIVFNVLSYVYSGQYQEEKERIVKEFLEDGAIVGPSTNAMGNVANGNLYSQVSNIMPSSAHASNSPPPRLPSAQFGTDHYCDPNPYPVPPLPHPSQLHPSHSPSSLLSSIPSMINRIYKKQGLYQQLSQGNDKKYYIGKKVEELLLEGGTMHGRGGKICDRINRKIGDIFEAMLLLAQVRFYIYNDLISALRILEQLSYQIPPYHIIHHTLIHKFLQKLHMHIHSTYKLSTNSQYQQFFGNQNLRTLIIKSSYQYLKLWAYVGIPNNNISYHVLEKKFRKCLQGRKKIETIFGEGNGYENGEGEEKGEAEWRDRIDMEEYGRREYAGKSKRWCESLTVLYIDYLYMVLRDVEKTKKIQRNFQVNAQQKYFGRIDNKIYVCFLLDQQATKGKLCVQNISTNIKKLLGYNRSQLKSSSISRLLPSFFLQPHQSLIRNTFSPSTHSLESPPPYTFSKTILIKHAQQYYLPAQTQLRLVLDHTSNVKMQGYIELLDVCREGQAQYNWNNYFFVKADDEELLEIGPGLKEFVQLRPRKYVGVGDYFDSHRSQTHINKENQGMKSGRNGRLQKTNKYLYHNGVQYTYHLLRVFHSQKTQYLYYCLLNQPKSQYNIALFESPANLSINMNPLLTTTTNPPPITNINNITKINKVKYNAAFQNIEGYLTQYLKYQPYSMKFEDYETNLLQYFQEKQDIVQKKFNNPKNKILPTILTLLFFIILIIQILLIYRLKSNRSQNKSIIYDLGQLVDYYDGISRLAVYIQKQGYRRYGGVQYYYGYRDVEGLCIDVQQILQSIQKYTNETTLPNSTTTTISSLYSLLYITDPDLQSLSFSTLLSTLPSLFSTSISQPLLQFTKTTNTVITQDNLIKIILQICICMLCICIFVSILVMDYWIREYEYQVLRVLSGINTSVMFCNGIMEFLRRYVGGIVEGGDGEDKEDGREGRERKEGRQRNSRLQHASTISARQNSVRNLYNSCNISGTASPSPYFQQSLMMSSTNRHPPSSPHPNISLPLTTLQQKQIKQTDESQRKEQKIRPIYKPFLTAISIIILCIVGVIIGFIVMQKINREISIGKSIQGLLVILEREVRVTGVIIGYMGVRQVGMQEMEENRRKMYDVFWVHHNRYKELENVQTLFQEAKYQQFVDFAKLYQQINYVYLCEYMPCQQQYRNDVNITYNSLIHRFTTYMNTTISSYMANSTPSSTTTPTTDPNLSLLFYLHNLHEALQTKLLHTYLQNYQTYQNNKSYITELFYLLQLIIVIVYGFVFVVYCCKWREKKELYSEYLGFVKKESYENGEGDDAARTTREREA